jgi:hypothetical protein
MDKHLFGLGLPPDQQVSADMPAVLPARAARPQQTPRPRVAVAS